MIPHPLMVASGNSYSHSTPRSSLPPATGGAMEDTSLITNGESFQKMVLRQLIITLKMMSADPYIILHKNCLNGL